jgi:acetyl-CoA acyltransferase
MVVSSACADTGFLEVNDAFAAIPMAWLIALDAGPKKLSVNGGAIADVTIIEEL